MVRSATLRYSVSEGMRRKGRLSKLAQKIIIITDDSQAERSGLKKTWPNTSLYLCVSHFLQTMWRWLLHSNNGIHIQHRQHLMQLIRNMVYANTEDVLNNKSKNLKQDSISKQYENYIRHVDTYWERRQEWAICSRDNTSTRGINTNNYAEAGIRILKDIIFQTLRPTIWFRFLNLLL